MALENDIAQKANEVAREDFLGASEWKRSRIGWLTGFSAGRRAISDTASVIGRSTSGMMSIGRAAFHRKAVAPLDCDSEDPAERFAAASHYYRRTAADIELDVRTTSKMFNLYFLLTCGIIALAVATLGHRREGFLLFDLIARFSLVPALMSLMIRAGFYNWQLRTRRLGGLMDYLKTPSAWVPATSGLRGVARAAMLAIVLCGASMALPVEADAQTIAPPTSGNSCSNTQQFQTPCNTDLWYEMLEYVFPNVGPIGSSFGDNTISGADSNVAAAITSAFSAFLALLMAVSAFMLSYHIISGSAETAHQGEVLGRKFHTLWAPIRVATGCGMLAPVVKGYCIAQLFTLQVVLWSGEMGNTIWQSWVTSITTGQYTPNITLMQVPIMAREILLAETCAKTVDRLNVNFPSIDDTTGLAAGGITSATKAPYFPSWSQGNSGSDITNTLDFGVCGQIGVNYANGNSSSSQNDPTAAARSKFGDSRYKAVRALALALQPVAEAIDAASDKTQKNPPSLPVFATVSTAITTYSASINSAAQDFIQSIGKNGTSLSTVKKAMVNKGWASAGTFYMTFSQIYASEYDLAAQTISVTPPIMADIPESVRSDLSSGGAGSNEASGSLVKLENWWDRSLQTYAAVSTDDPSIAAVAKLSQSLGESSGFTEIMDWIFGKALAGGINTFAIDISQGPAILQEVAFGHTILNIATGAIGILLALKVGAGIASKVIGTSVAGWALKIGGAMIAKETIGAILGVLTPLILSALGLLFMVGLVHAYVLPMIPYFFMFFFVAGMLILTVEGVIAAPLWALFHIRMDGEELIDRVQKPGYEILFNLFLRIPLALFGMFFSYLVFDALAWFISQTFQLAFTGAVGAHALGPIGVLVACAMVAYLNYQAAMRSFGLITHVPDRVGRWFGASSDHGMRENEASIAAVGIFTQRTEQNASQALQGALGRGGAPGGGRGRSPSPGGLKDPKPSSATEEEAEGRPT